MQKRDKAIIGLMLVIIALLAIGVFSLTNKIATLENSIQTIANTKQLPVPAPTVINGKDGLSIKGDNGEKGNTGENGKDSISTREYFETKIIEQQPIKGDTGAPGKDAPEQEIRLNESTGNLESKKSDKKFWTVLIPCEKLIVSCLKDTVTKPIEAL